MSEPRGKPLAEADGESKQGLETDVDVFVKQREDILINNGQYIYVENSNKENDNQKDTEKRRV